MTDAANVIEIRKLWTEFPGAERNFVVHQDLDLSVQRGEARLEQLGDAAAPGSAVFDRLGTMVGMVLPESAGFGVRAVPVTALLDPSDERTGG